MEHERKQKLHHRPIAGHAGHPAVDPPRDLADFHLHWSKYRPAMMALQKSRDLTLEQADTLGWLIALSDRVSDQDIG